MTPWQRLEIAPTSDLAAIKKAYKLQLKKHHPEDDPAGFQQVRAAYEMILEEVGNDTAPVIDNVATTVVTPPPVNMIDEHALIPWVQYNAILDDPAQRLTMERWQEWQRVLLMEPLDSQQASAAKILDDVLDKPWLPGEIVQLFWDVFDWENLLNSNDEHYNIGQWLQSRASLNSMVPLNDLAALSHSEQRAILAFTQPLARALSVGNMALIHYWLSQPTCVPLSDTAAFQTTLLQCCNSCYWYPPVIEQELVPHLSSPDVVKHLSAQQLDVVAEATLKIGDVEAILGVATQMVTQHLFRQASDLLYQTSRQANERDYALVLAYLQQQQQPLPLAFWRCEHWLNPAYASKPSRAHRWLYQSLFNNADLIFRQHLDFKEETGLLGFLTRALWHAEHGSLVWQMYFLDALVTYQDDVSPFERLLLQLVHQHCVDSLQQQSLGAGAPSLIEKLKGYETDEFLRSDALTKEEIDSLTSTQWMDCLTRHPLIPDSWLDALIEHGKLSLDIIEQHERRLHWVYVTLFQRVANRQFRFSSIYQDDPFDGVFNWVLLFNSYYTPQHGLSGNQLLTELSALPAKQQHGPLGHLVAYFEHHNHYNSQWVDGCDGQQLVFRSLVNNALNALLDHTDLDTLKTMALAGNIESLAALCLHYHDKDLLVSIAYWQLFRTYTHGKPQFQEFYLRTRNLLADEAIKRELVPQTIDFMRTDAFLVFITDEALPTPETLLTYTPDKQAARFAYPMCYLLAILNQGWHESGYNLTPLSDLKRHRQSYSADEQQVIDTAFAHLDQLHQTKLEQAIRDEKSVKTFSVGRIMLSVMVFIIAWFFVFDYTLSDNAIKPSLLWWVEVALLSLGQWSVTWRILRVVPSPRKRSIYIAVVWLLYLLALTFSSTWLAVGTCVIHIMRLLCSAKIVYCRGRWRKSIVNTKQVNIAELFGRAK